MANINVKIFSATLLFILVAVSFSPLLSDGDKPLSMDTPNNPMDAISPDTDDFQGKGFSWDCSERTFTMNDYNSVCIPFHNFNSDRINIVVNGNCIISYIDAEDKAGLFFKNCSDVIISGNGSLSFIGFNSGIVQTNGDLNVDHLTSYLKIDGLKNLSIKKSSAEITMAVGITISAYDSRCTLSNIDKIDIDFRIDHSIVDPIGADTLSMTEKSEITFENIGEFRMKFSCLKNECVSEGYFIQSHSVFFKNCRNVLLESNTKLGAISVTDELMVDNSRLSFVYTSDGIEDVGSINAPNGISGSPRCSGDEYLCYDSQGNEVPFGPNATYFVFKSLTFNNVYDTINPLLMKIIVVAAILLALISFGYVLIARSEN